MSEGAVVTEVKGGVGIMRINRADKFNCLSPEVFAGLDAALTAHEADPSVRALLICSEGKHFCTGADLDRIMALRENRADLKSFIHFGNQVLLRLEASPLPVVGAVQGYCLAGGIELMMSCDVIIAADNARIGDQHANFGLVPGWGGSQRLTRLVGVRRSLDLMMSGRHLSADEALAWGLANQVVPAADLQAKAEEYCAAMVTKSATGLATMKRLARQGIEMSLAESIDFEEEIAVDAIMSDEVSEGLDAFQNRRTPVFAPRKA
ncbi:MAG: enoyl-CoA hydratase/isomerase family protein [Gammaproteobacteria bacterium]|nr:enoyl-CoA hydratase/isomerase family protein [Gammaproteobacteria bacterium]